MSLLTFEGNCAQTPDSEEIVLASVEHARELRGVLHSAWWKAYCDRSKSPEGEATERTAKAALDQVTEAAKKKFGNNRAHPECDYCLTVSVFGGPSHEASRYCRSGKRSHCSCSTCF